MTDDEVVDLSSFEAMGTSTLYHAECLRCGRWENVVPKSLYDYHLENGVIVTSFGRVIWCNGCDGIQVGETLPELSLYESSLRDLIENGIDTVELQKKADFLRTKIDSAEEFSRQTAELHVKVDWLRNRKLPNRCLVCGSVDIHDLGRPLTHPKCGGQFELSFKTSTSTQRHAINRIPTKTCE